MNHTITGSAINGNANVVQQSTRASVTAQHHHQQIASKERRNLSQVERENSLSFYYGSQESQFRKSFIVLHLRFVEVLLLSEEEFNIIRSWMRSVSYVKVRFFTTDIDKDIAQCSSSLTISAERKGNRMSALYYQLGLPRIWNYWIPFVQLIYMLYRFSFCIV